jgi:putative photosynthetic complex assembly protein 2
VQQVIWPFAFTIAVWWVSTGVILFLDRLPRHTFKWTMGAATLLCLFAFAGLAETSRHTTVASAYCAFSCALLVWAWQEVAFLLGYVTGSRREPCPPAARGWARARAAFSAIDHHEFVLLALAICVYAMTMDEPNRTGWWTFLILWTMRQSAKLNVFLGVRNLSERFLPEHLHYLQTYFARKPMNGLLPISVIAATAFAVPLWQAALASEADTFALASNTLLAALLSLAIVEHVFLVLPLSLEKLWTWGIADAAPDPGPAVVPVPVAAIKPSADG